MYIFLNFIMSVVMILSGVSSESLTTKAKVKTVDFDRQSVPMRDYQPLEVIQTENDSDLLLKEFLNESFGLVGKVRYVWGGGHHESALMGTKGLPLWESFNRIYGDSGKGVVPHVVHKHYQPLPTYTDTVENFLNQKENYKSLLDNQSFVDYLKTTNKGYLDFRFEGLDCSGFVNVILNTLDIEGEPFNYLAESFGWDNRFIEVPERETYHSGDLISWGEHIIAVVGQFKKNEPVYIIVESTVGVLRLGVAYHSEASLSTLVEAKEYVDNVNKTYDINIETNKSSMYNLDNKGFADVVELINNKVFESNESVLVDNFGRINKTELTNILNTIIEKLTEEEQSTFVVDEHDKLVQVIVNNSGKKAVIGNFIKTLEELGYDDLSLSEQEFLDLIENARIINKDFELIPEETFTIFSGIVNSSFLQVHSGKRFFKVWRLKDFVDSKYSEKDIKEIFRWIEEE